MGYKQVSPIPILEGGTNNTVFPNPFGIAYYDGTKLNNIVPGTSGYFLQSQGSGGVAQWAPISGSGAITTVDGNSGSVTPTAGVITISGDGTILSSSGSGSTLSFTTQSVYTVATSSGTATASSNSLTIVGSGTVSTSASGSTITITGTGGGGGLTWNDQTSTTVTMAVNNGYVMDSASLITATLPATAAFGSTISVSGKGTGLWTIAQNAGQTIHFGAISTTTGTGGSLSSSGQYDQISLLCITANTDFVVTYSVGNLQYV